MNWRLQKPTDVEIPPSSSESDSDSDSESLSLSDVDVKDLSGLSDMSDAEELLVRLCCAGWVAAMFQAAVVRRS